MSDAKPVGHHGGCPECSHGYTGEHGDTCSQYTGPRDRPPPYEHCDHCEQLVPVGMTTHTCATVDQ